MKMDENWDIPDEYLTAIGRITVRWSKLESIMDLSLIELLGKSILEGRSLVVFAHMAFPQKMDIMGALIVECLTNSTYSWLKRYKTDVEPLIRGASKQRNTIIHSKYGLDAPGVVGRSNISAHGSLSMTRTVISIKEIEAVSHAIAKAADALFDLVFAGKPSSEDPHKGQ